MYMSTAESVNILRLTKTSPALDAREHILAVGRINHSRYWLC